MCRKSNFGTFEKPSIQSGNQTQTKTINKYGNLWNPQKCISIMPYYRQIQRGVNQNTNQDHSYCQFQETLMGSVKSSYSSLN